MTVSAGLPADDIGVHGAGGPRREKTAVNGSWWPFMAIQGPLRSRLPLRSGLHGPPSSSRTELPDLNRPAAAPCSNGEWGGLDPHFPLRPGKQKGHLWPFCVQDPAAAGRRAPGARLQGLVRQPCRAKASWYLPKGGFSPRPLSRGPPHLGRVYPSVN